MPIIYLNHPVHGTKVAIAESEAETDEKNGWVRYTLDAPAAPAEAEAPEATPAPEVPNFLSARVRRRAERV